MTGAAARRPTEGELAERRIPLPFPSRITPSSVPVLPFPPRHRNETEESQEGEGRAAGPWCQTRRVAELTQWSNGKKLRCTSWVRHEPCTGYQRHLNVGLRPRRQEVSSKSPPPPPTAGPVAWKPLQTLPRPQECRDKRNAHRSKVFFFGFVLGT